MPAKRSRRSPLELQADELAWRCADSECAFGSSDDVAPLNSIVGQDRALRAVELGLSVRSPGYNLYVSGLPGSGRNTSIRLYLQQLAPSLPAPSDWCYLRNFREEYRPTALELPPGSGPMFALSVESAVRHAIEEIERLLDSDELATLRNTYLHEQGEKREQVFQELRMNAESLGFRVEFVDGRPVPAPLDTEGQPLTPEAFSQLPEEQRAAIEKKTPELDDRLGQALQQIRRLDRQTSDGLREIERTAARRSMEPIFDELRASLPVSADSRQGAYLGDVLGDLLDQVDDIRAFDEPLMPGHPPDRRARRERLLERYRVNVFVTNGSGGAPVIFENNATYYNVFGRADYRAVGGLMVTGHTQIQAGSLHRANGGFLVLQAADVFGPQGIWEPLKKCLRSGEINIEALGEQIRSVPTQSISPAPIPLTAKVIIVGTPGVYQLGWSSDEDFRKLFKVRADFAPDMDRTPASIGHLASFVRRRCDTEGLPSFDKAAIARVIEHAARLAGHQQKLSTRFVDLADIVTEAAYWRSERDGGGPVNRDDVSRAIEQKQFRGALYEDRLQQMIADGTIHIRTSGEAIGQVNGMSVYEMAEHSFGRPTRITARVSLGEGEFVHLERETEMSGRLHSKGFLSLVGYLQGKYGTDRPLALSASLGFEQIYDEIEGDSAASAELYALLSELGQFPLKQGIAVTGSVNQLGEVQAVGGVIEKVEGFFEVCRTDGLSGEQGVIIPTDNKRNLMLRDDVIEAVRSGQFHVWAVSTVDEGLEILAGIPAGIAGQKGYPADSIHGRVTARLDALVQKQGEFAARLDGQSPSPAGKRRNTRTG
ncbi:MAG TPA: ATP-binding protein [Dehalococcoidia bacterium]|nr:ATP-binding protein [Dehalococcoidia bacterium]